MAAATALAPLLNVQSSPRVLIMEGVPGNERWRRLECRLRETAPSGARAWMLSCDFDLGGPWAGVKDLFTSLLPEIEATRPDLVKRHSLELIHVLPQLQRSLVLPHPTLTDVASDEERTRHYAPDRAFRIVHGLINLLDTWKKIQEPGTHWLIACDFYCQAGAIGAHFFRELIRRRGEQLKIHLLLGVDPGRSTAVRDSFPSGVPVVTSFLNLPGESPETLAPDAAAQQASELEKEVGDSLLGKQLALPELIRLWQLAGRPDKVLRYRYFGFDRYYTQGLYADAFRYGKDLVPMAAEYAEEDKSLRWQIMSKVLACHLAMQDAQTGLQLAEGEAAHFVEHERPLWRGQLCYSSAMLCVRYSKQRELAKAEEYLDRGLGWIQSDKMLSEADLHFSCVFNRNGLALIRSFQGRYGEAIELCRSGLAELDAHLPPEKHRLHRSLMIHNLAQVCVALGADEDAIQYYSAAIGMDPNYSEYYNERGSIFFRLGRLEEARADYLKAIELSPPYFEVLINLGQCYRLMGAMESAIESYSQALDLQPDQLLALLGRAKAHEEWGHAGLAIADYTAAIEHDPAQWEAIASRGVLHYEAGNLLAALADFDRALMLKPGEPDLQENRAVVLADLGNRSEAAS